MNANLLRRMALVSIGLAIGCGSSKNKWTDHYDRRPLVERQLDSPIEVLDIEVLSDDQVLAVASSGESWAALSQDGGNTWKRVAPMGDVKEIRYRAIASSKGGVFLLTSAGVFRTEDTGNTWVNAFSDAKGMAYDLFGTKESAWVGRRGGAVTAIDTGKKLNDAGVVTSLLELPSKTLLAASFGKGVFRSTDQGSTWKPSVQGLATTNVSTLLLLPKGDVLAATFGGGVARSSDEGVTWTASNQGLDDLEVQALVTVGEGRVFAGAQRGLFQSDDEGHTWKRLAGSLGKDNVNALAANSKGYVFAGTWGNGLYRSKDRGGLWAYVDVRAMPPTVSTLTARPEGPLYVGLQNGDVFKLTPESGRWVSAGKMDNSAVRYLAVDPEGKVFGATRSKLFRFDETKSSWEQFPFVSSGMQIRGLVVGGAGRILVETYEDRVALYVTENLGESWTPVKADCLRVEPSGALIAGPLGTTVAKGCSCVSENGGRDWKAVNMPGRCASLLDVNCGCRLTAGRDLTIGATVTGRSSASLYAVANGALRKRADLEGQPKCVAVLPDGAIAMTIESDVMVIPPHGSKPEKRSERPGCRALVARQNGHLVMLDGSGIHRSVDGGRNWIRIDELKSDAEPGSDEGK